jgi:FtsH-binding integral membrane protein
MQHPAAEMVQARRVLFLAWLLTLYARTFLEPKKESRADVAPALSGTGVVVGTGMAAVYFITRDPSDSAAIPLAAAIGVLTLVTAWFVFRFASKHANEIGEARFVTTNPDAGKSDDV